MPSSSVDNTSNTSLCTPLHAYLCCHALERELGHGDNSGIDLEAEIEREIEAAGTDKMAQLNDE